MLAEIVDEKTNKVLNILKRDGSATDQKIADELELRPNTVRRILNELHTRNLLTYRREREATGWYNYIWTLNPAKVVDFIILEKSRAKTSLKNRIAFESNNQFFMCKEGCAKLVYDQAFEANFKCPICNTELAPHKNEAILKKLREELDAVEASLKKCAEFKKNMN
jgi:transcription initiation factor TFIIE subunit alpha